MKAPLALLSLLTISLFAASPFTTEEFNTAINTSRWFIYNYETGEFTAPDWNAVDGGANPEASTTFTAGNGVSFIANEASSLGTFTGDFYGAGIEGLDCDIFAEDASLIQSVEFFFLHDGVFYFSDPLSLNNDGWSLLQYSFTTDPWYTLEDGIFVDALVTDEILSDLSQIGVDFLPFAVDEAIGSRVGLDNFTLMGHVPTTPLKIAKENANDLALSFSRKDSFSYTIEANEELTRNGWNPLSPETTDLSGTEPFETTIPRSVRQFFRLMIRPLYYAVPDIGA